MAVSLPLDLRAHAHLDADGDVCITVKLPDGRTLYVEASDTDIEGCIWADDPQVTTPLTAPTCAEGAVKED